MKVVCSVLVPLQDCPHPTSAPRLSICYLSQRHHLPRLLVKHLFTKDYTLESKLCWFDDYSLQTRKNT